MRRILSTNALAIYAAQKSNLTAENVELSTEQHYNMINGLLNNGPTLLPQPPVKELNKVKGPPTSIGAGSLRSGDRNAAAEFISM